MDMPRGNYAKWNKEKKNKEKDKNHDLTYMWNLKKNKTELIDTDWYCQSRGMRGGGKGEGSQEVQASSYNMSKSLGCNVQHGDYNQ